MQSITARSEASTAARDSAEYVTVSSQEMKLRIPAGSRPSWS
jgi:hypothetical protein